MEHPQAIIGLLRRPDGAIVVLTAAADGRPGETIEVPAGDGTKLLAALETILGRADAPRLESAPGAKKTESAGSKATDPAYAAKVDGAYKTMLSELERKAKQEWGAPVVDAATTIVGDVAKKAKETFARSGPSRKYALRQKIARGTG